jgi:hypothetical protein
MSMDEGLDSVGGLEQPDGCHSLPSQRLIRSQHVFPAWKPVFQVTGLINLGSGSFPDA